MKRKQVILSVSGIVLCGIALTAGISYAYLSDKETAVNVVSLGEISVELEEESFTEPSEAVPGSEFPKDPKVKNTGNRDAFVYLKVIIPRQEITVLNDDGKKKYPDPAKSSRELFSLKSNQSQPKTVSTNIFPEKNYDIDFSYCSDWVLVDKEEITITTPPQYEDCYVFGYHQKLAPDLETSTLFDKAKIKNFINGEVTGDFYITIEPLAIQADELKITDLTDNYLNSPSEDDIKRIYNVLKAGRAVSP